MKLKITVNSHARDSDYGGEQIINIKEGEFLLDEIFRLHFFRVIIDLIVDGNVCFRPMEGSQAHYFILNKSESQAFYERETSIGYDSFSFKLLN